jgi:parallel beta-helix repeat protein
MKIFILIVFLIFPAILIAQTTYYVSSSEGNDANAGTNTIEAWQSLAKVNSFKPNPGDQILFRRGDKWEGTLIPSSSGSSGSPIVYGAYGSGDKPKIYGSAEITGWTLLSDNVYIATVGQDINQLFLNDTRIQLARYPKTGYFDVTSVDNTTQFASTSVPGDIDYSGAKAIIRTNRWGMATKTVTNSSSETLTIDSAPLYAVTEGDGFFLNNKLDFLTAPGEYYYDAATKTVYLWTPNGDAPSNYEVRGSVLSNLISINRKNYITIENLGLIHSSGIAIATDYCNYLTFDKLDIINPDSKGLYLNHDTYGNYKNIKIDGANHIGFHAQFTSHSNIIDNTIINTALFDNLGLTGMGGEQDGRAYTSTAGTDNIIRYNYIENVGYGGISWRTPNTIIDKNVIKNACLVKDDGGAIYSWSSNPLDVVANGSEVTNNIILNTIGSDQGTSASYPYAVGIYIDNGIQEVKVENNTVANSTTGIFLNSNSGNITVNNNTVMDAALLFLATDLYAAAISTISNNTFYATQKIASYTWWTNGTQRLARVKNSNVTMDNNKYFHHYSDFNLFSNGSGYLSWPEWMDYVEGENSTIDLTQLASGESEELFYNDTKQTKVFDLGTIPGAYRDLDGNAVSGELSLEPFTSKILIKTDIASSTSVQKKQTSGISVYPNPTNGKFTVQAKDLPPDISKISLFNMMGEKVFEQHFSSSSRVLEETFDLPNLNNGAYVVRMACGSTTYQSKLIFNNNK